MSEAQEVKNAVSIVRNRRTDAMFSAAYIMVLALAYTVIFEDAISQYAQGVITLVLGNFIGYLTAMYNFETGATRGEMTKADTIKGLAEKQIAATEQRQVQQDSVVQDIAKSVPLAAATAAAATVLANGHPPTVTPAPPNPETGNVPAAEVQPTERKDT